MTPLTRSWIGLLIPGTIAFAAVADAGMRLLPRAAVSFRAWEAARTPGGDGPFLPDFTYRSARAYGDLAALGNLPADRDVRPEFFVTDSFGYPNAPDALARGRAGLLLYGSSYSVGAEVPAGEGLASQLARRTGQVVYNAASGDYRLPELLAVARRVLRPGGTVVFEYPESRDAPGPVAVLAPRGVAACRERLTPVRAAGLCPRWFALRRHLEFSPLAVLAQRGRKRLENDRIFRNPYATNVLQRRLGDGAVMLFLADDTLRAHRPPGVPGAARGFHWLRGKVEGAGFRLVVLLVPDKYTVYRRLLAPPDSTPVPGERYLPDLAARLRGDGIPVADLSAAFRAAARRDLETGTTLYFRDDTHWNARGIALASDTLAVMMNPGHFRRLE
jgi:acetyltransferase AlgX (SGNH hydrolase-like protein)